MTADTAYHFLKPSLEQLTDREKEELCRLINGTPAPLKKVKKDPIMSKVEMKKKLMKSHFKSKEY